MRALAAALLVLLVAACGKPEATPSPSASGSPAIEAPSPTPRVEVAAVVQELKQMAVVSASGVLWTATVGPGDSLMGGSPSSLIVLTSERDVVELDSDGRRQVLGHLDGRVDQAVASPDGKRWVWSTVDSTTSTPAVTSLHLAGVDTSPRTLMTNSENQLLLEPRRWTADGIWVEHNVSGLGGRYAFGFNTGPVDLVDPETGHATRLQAPNNCFVADRARDGTLACLNRPSSNFSSFYSVTIQSPVGRSLTTLLPRPDYSTAGNLVFSPDGSRLYIGADNYDGTQDHYRTGVLDTRTGSLTTLVEGYAPALPQAQSLLPDGSLLLARYLQQPGLWIQAPSGSITELYPSGAPAGRVAA